MGGVELGYEVCKGSRYQSEIETNGGMMSAGGAPVQPLASSPRPWRKMIVAREDEGFGAGMIMGVEMDMIWKNGFCG